MKSDNELMSECILLAENGKGFVSPNPLVGCVIINNGKIVGKGNHEKYGESHAEVNAVADAKRNMQYIKGSTLFVNLEPCSHTGKTSPCADLLIKEKISEVVIGMKDPNKEVNGKGIKKLRDAGIKVRTGILSDECMSLNKFYLKFVQKKLPYVSLKIAQSIDGKIALNNFNSKWITGNESRKFVHQLRSEYDAVMIGRNTAQSDNPSLTVRDFKGRNPKRIVIDYNSSLPPDLKIFTDKKNALTYIVKGVSDKTGNKAIRHINNSNIIRAKEKNQRLILKSLLNELYLMNISSVLVEGGANLFSQFAETDLFDEIFLFIAPKIIGKGISSFNDFEITNLNNSGNLKAINSQKFGNDLLINYKNVYRNYTK